MTRKKFVKMLMSRGLSRNKANAYAAKTRAESGTYERCYRDLRLRPFYYHAKAWKAARDSFRAYGETVREVCAALKQLSNELRGAENRLTMTNEACDTCLRWPECNGVDANSCPIVQAQTKNLERA